ncbi:MAG TPA: hypothetical protein VHT34_02425 [Clostridia bacterium]|nr:hypothetical protein [Clostridia bacterium]
MKLKCIPMVIALILLASCGSNMEKPSFDPPVSSRTVSLQNNKNINFDVYIDSTASMGGYAVSGISTGYVNALTGISSMATSLSGTLGSVQYHSFGMNIVNISQEQFMNARNQSFYTSNAANSKRTFISEVIKKSVSEFAKSSDNANGKSNMSIIITDLFEDNSNVDPLINYIRKDCGQSDISIGVLALKSYFKGRVYDIGRNINGKPYESDLKDSRTYRPFYIVIIGKAGDVCSFYEQLDRLSLSSMPQDSKYFELFNKNSVEKSGQLGNESEILTQNGKRQRIKADEQVKPDSGDKRVECFRAYISGVPDKDRLSEMISSEFEVSPMAYSRLKYAIDTGKNIYGDKDSLIKVSAKMERYENRKYTAVASGQTDLKVTKATVENGKVKTCLSVNPYDLKQGYYRIDLVVSYDGELLKPVVPDDWNMKDEADPLFGQKTIYLYNLLEGFYDLFKNDHERLAEVYYYLKILK